MAATVLLLSEEHSRIWRRNGRLFHLSRGHRRSFFSVFASVPGRRATS